MAEEQPTSGLKAGQLQIDTGSTWNFKSGKAAEMSFFKKGKMMILDAKEQFKGQKQSLNFQVKALKKDLKDQLKIDLKAATTGAEKRAIKKTYNLAVKDLNTEYKADLKEINQIKQDAIAAGKAATAEAFRTGYTQPTAADKTAPVYESEYAQERARLETQNDSVAEALPTAEDLLISLQESQQQFAEMISGSTSEALSGVSESTKDMLNQMQIQQQETLKAAQEQLAKTQAVGSETQLAIQEQTEKQLEKQEKLSTAQLKQQADLAAKQFKQQESIQEQDARQFAQAQEQSAEQFTVEQATLAEQFKAEQEALAAQLEIQQKAYEQQGLAISQQGEQQAAFMAQLEAQQQQEAEQFAQQYGLQQETIKQRQLALEQQKASMEQQAQFAQQQQLREEQAYERQLVRFRNQARMNLTPELQIQPGAQGKNIGGTSMFKRPGVRVRTAEREQIIPRDTLGITQQSETNSLNIV